MTRTTVTSTLTFDPLKWNTQHIMTDTDISRRFTDNLRSQQRKWSLQFSVKKDDHFQCNKTFKYKTWKRGKWAGTADLPSSGTDHAELSEWWSISPSNLRSRRQAHHNLQHNDICHWQHGYTVSSACDTHVQFNKQWHAEWISSRDSCYTINVTHLHSQSWMAMKQIYIRAQKREKFFLSDMADRS